MGYRFTAVMPLVMGPRLRCGSLTILGAEPRERFGLHECAFLERKAREAVELLRRGGLGRAAEQAHLCQRLASMAKTDSTSPGSDRGDESDGDGSGMEADDSGDVAGEQTDRRRAVVEAGGIS